MHVSLLLLQLDVSEQQLRRQKGDQAWQLMTQQVLATSNSTSQVLSGGKEGTWIPGWAHLVFLEE
jgi:hypothetical protein